MEYLIQAWNYLKAAWANTDLKTLVLLLGATWAFYKIIQRGSLHPLLDLKAAGKFIWIANRGYLLCSLEVKNVHLPMVLMEYSGLRLSFMREAPPLKDDKPSPPVIWEYCRTFPVLERNQKVWSGEIIRDRILLVAPDNEVAFKVEFRIARKYRWYQHAYKWFTGRSSWSAVAIVKREPEEKAGGKNDGQDPR